MGFFDSDSTTETTTTTQNVGFSDIGGPAVAVQGSGNRVQLTDQGALKLAGEISENALEQVELSNKAAAKGVSQAVEAVAESAREESENIVANIKTIAFMGIIAWAVVGFARQFAKG